MAHLDLRYNVVLPQRFRRPGAGVPPLPIPNREVKPCSADGTGVTPGRVGRRLIYSKASFKQLAFLRLRLFLF